MEEYDWNFMGDTSSAELIKYKAEKEKRDFLREKFDREIKNIKSMKDFISVFMKYNGHDSYKSFSIKSVSNIMEILFNPKFDRNIIAFYNGGGNVFDIWDFDKGVGSEFANEAHTIAQFLDGEFKLKSEHSIIPSHFYDIANYDYVIENF